MFLGGQFDYADWAVALKVRTPALFAGLAPPPEIDRVHSVSSDALVVAVGDSYAYLTEPFVEDVAFVNGTLHPAFENGTRPAAGARALADVLGVGASGVAVAL